ncbi:hypothetical protein HID58_062222, partial [Brassica napus]
ILAKVIRNYILVGLGQSLIVIEVVFLVAGLPSIMAPRFVDFILSLFISLFSHLVASFIADHVFGGSLFCHIYYSRMLFMVSSLSFSFSVVGFHSPPLRLFIFFSCIHWCRFAEVLWFFAGMGALYVLV